MKAFIFTVLIGKTMCFAPEIDQFSSYIYKVLKQVHPNKGIKPDAISVMKALTNKVSEKIAVEAVKLVQDSHEDKLSSREIQTAVRLMLPGEVGKHAMPVAMEAVTKKYALNIPVEAFMNFLTMLSAANEIQVGAGAPVYLAAVLEYLAAEILELAGKSIMTDSGEIGIKDLERAASNNPDLSTIMIPIVDHVCDRSGKHVPRCVFVDLEPNFSVGRLPTSRE